MKPIKSLSILVLLLSAVFTPLSAHAQTYPQPWRIYANVEYQVGYMGCVYKIQHGQYGAFGFANINYVAGDSGCRQLISNVATNKGARPTPSFVYPPWPNGVTAAYPGKESWAIFQVFATKYGLVCSLRIVARPNGTWYTSSFKDGGDGKCPTRAAWIRRIWR